MEQHRIKVVRRIFFSESSGFGVFVAHFPNEKDRLVIAGTLPGVSEGDSLDIFGEEVFHPRFGRQIKVHSFSHYIPDDLDGVKAFLSCGRFKGVGPKTAQKLVDGFGTDLLRVLEKEPDRLTKVRGLSAKLARAIGEQYQVLSDQRNLMIKLVPFGIGQETLYKLLSFYGRSVMDVLSSNPFRTISEVKGIGFKTADTLARAFGFEKHHPLRIQSALLWLMEQAEQRQGDLYLPVSELLFKASRQFDLPEAVLSQHLKVMIARGILLEVTCPFAGVVRPANYWIEKTIADKMTELMNYAVPSQPEQVTSTSWDFTNGGDLTANQHLAVQRAFLSPVQIITGGPGTGKTTIIKKIVEKCMALGWEVAVATPTGRAAKRVEETSGYPASTIHRLLKINPDSLGFVHHESNPLDMRMIIIDEFSMVDAYLFSSLLKAIKRGTHLILLGDKDQLPSVGPGNVIRDLINSALFPITILTHNFRQEKAAGLVDRANRIQAGQADSFLQECLYDDERFSFILASDERQAQEHIMQQMEALMAVYAVSSLEYQVLSPMYRGDAGVEMLNRLIQERFNHQELLLDLNGHRFLKGDRIMQLRNNYQLEIYNGEQGVVIDYDKQSRLLKVDFGERVLELTREQLEDIMLSYATSVHKAQGGEFRTVLLCLLPSHGIMLNRELFYTALTRARERFILVSNKQALAQAISVTMPQFRRTLLPQRLLEGNSKQKKDRLVEKTD